MKDFIFIVLSDVKKLFLVLSGFVYNLVYYFFYVGFLPVSSFRHFPTPDDSGVKTMAFLTALSSLIVFFMLFFRSVFTDFSLHPLLIWLVYAMVISMALNYIYLVHKRCARNNEGTREENISSRYNHHS